MFDEHAKALFSDFPEFEGLSRENATRTLSAAYLSIVNLSTALMDWTVSQDNQRRSNPICGAWRILCCFT